MHKTVGAITIGQTPRDDVVPHLRRALGDEVEIIEAGGLDGLSRVAIEAERGKQGGALLVTRLRGGGEIRVHEELVTPRLQECVNRLEAQVDLILFLCTGDFPELRSSRPVLYPGPLLRNVVRGLNPTRLGVLTPAREQILPQRRRWVSLADHLVVEFASPYGGSEDLEAAAEKLSDAKVDLVAMDCIGYSQSMKELVCGKVGRPALLASTLVARVATELLD